MHTWFYKKVGGVFKLTGGGTSKGEWKTSYCKITPAPNTTGYLISQVLPASGTAVYRVEVGGQISNTLVPVHAKINYIKIP